MFNQCTRATLGRLTVGVALLTMAAFTAAGVARGAGVTPYVYTDKAGDSLSAPDIQKVVLTDKGDGTVGVEIDLAAVIPDDGDSMVWLGIDADRNRQTGDDARNRVRRRHRRDRRLDDEVRRKRLGGVQPHAVVAERSRRAAGLHADAVRLRRHELQLHRPLVQGRRQRRRTRVRRPSRYPDQSARPAIDGIVLAATALFPKAGSTFSITTPQVKLTTGDIVAADSVTCTLSYKGQAIKPARACAWKIPKTVKGKHLVLKVTAVYGASTKSISLTVTPR